MRDKLISVGLWIGRHLADSSKFGRSIFFTLLFFSWIPAVIKAIKLFIPIDDYGLIIVSGLTYVTTILSLYSCYYFYEKNQQSLDNYADKKVKELLDEVDEK